MRAKCMTRPVIRTGLDLMDRKRIAYLVSIAPIDRVWATSHQGRLLQYWSRYLEQPKYESLARTMDAKQHLSLREMQELRHLEHLAQRNRAKRRRIAQ